MTERSTDRIRRRRRQPGRAVSRQRRVRCIIVALLLVAGEARLAPVRWWRSSQVTEALGLTPDQSDQIDDVYQQFVPAGEEASVDVMRLTEEIVEALRAGNFDDDLLRATAALVRARDEQCALRRQVFARAAAALQPRQRFALARLLAQRRVID